MPWNEVTVKEQRQDFSRDYRMGYYTICDLASGREKSWIGSFRVES